MRRVLMAGLLVLWASAAGAQIGYRGPTVSSGGTSVPFANLGTPADGAFYYCTDCAQTSPCADGGSGAFAYRIGGAWECAVDTGLPSTGGTGIVAQTAGSTTAARTITGATGESCTNGDGVSGNPTCGPDRTMVPFRGVGSSIPAECGDTGDAYRLGDLFYLTPRTVLFACDQIDHWTPVTTGLDIFRVEEEFISGSNTAPGGNAFTLANIASGSTVQMQQGLTHAPGVVNWAEGTSGDGTGFYWGGGIPAGTFGLDFDLEFNVIPGGSAGSSIADTGQWYGLAAGTNPAAIAAAFWVVRDTSLTHDAYVCAMCDSTTTGCQEAGDATNQDSVVSSVTPSAGTAANIRLWRRSVGVGGIATYYCSVNGEAPKTFCASGCDSTAANAPSATMYPMFAFVAKATAAKNMAVDYFGMTVMVER